MRLPLTSNEIHLWLTFYEQIPEGSLLSAYREVLDQAEREQELRFHFQKDQRRYLVTRALVRTVLSRYLDILPSEWVFSRTAYGRPRIANPQAMGSGLDFNISHTHNLIVMTVTKDRTAGVDVEHVHQRKPAMEIAEHYFAAQEVRALAALPKDKQGYRFFEYWTLKESYVKARGLGLSLPLDKVSFSGLEGDTVQITLDPELGDDCSRWQFWRLQPRPEFIVSLCAERIGFGSPCLVVRETIPMSDRELTGIPRKTLPSSGVSHSSQQQA